MTRDEMIVRGATYVFASLFIAACLYLAHNGENQTPEPTQDTGLIQLDSDSVELTTEPYKF